MQVCISHFILYLLFASTFFAINKNGFKDTIFKASDIKIQRHPKIKANANPYSEKWEMYFEKRKDEIMLNKLDKFFKILRKNNKRRV